MIPDFLATAISGEISLTLLISLLSVAIVWFPFERGLRVCLQAHRITRRPKDDEIERALRSAGGDRSVTVEMLEVLRSAARDGAGTPAAFVIDAARQCVSNEYDTRYARTISMYANVLPPIGFIGTTVGLLILFVSMGVESHTLELGALALALVSSICALIGYAFLEALRIRLYRRMIARLDDAVVLFRRSAPRSAAKAGRAPVAGGAPSVATG